MVPYRMRWLRFVLVALLPLGCHRPLKNEPVSAPRAPASTGLTAQLMKVESILMEQQNAQHIPGLAFAVVKDDQVIYLKALGLRDREQQLPATVDTVFPIGSCTKAFTAMAVAISQEEGTLSLDDSPHKFLPYFKMADPEADAQVTLRDMLSHRTGLKAYADLAAEPAILTREEYVRAATTAKPSAKFRTTFQYSNAMFAAVGEIVGKANASTWEGVIAKQILGPLGMESTFTATEEALWAANHATGYIYLAETGGFRPVPPPRSLAALAPAGSMVSTARDLTKWLRMLSGSGRLGSRRLVSEARFQELTTAHIPIKPGLSYALGWARYDWNGLHVIEHNGGSQGLSALVSFIPERHVGFVFLGNTSANFMTQIGNAGKLLWPLILGQDERGVSVQPTNASLPQAPAASAPPSAASAADPTPLPLVAELPPVPILLQRMVRAAGGEQTLRRHTAVKIQARKAYDNQGVTAALTIWAQTPSRHAEEELWTAAGKSIGRIRVYFDGVRGGQETTFGQDAENDDRANEEARRENALPPYLDLQRLYKEIRVLKRAQVGAEETYVMELAPERGEPVRLYVSARTALVIKREAAGQSTTFSDYRPVDGELVPFRRSIQDGLGETTVEVKAVRFNGLLPDTAFAPTKR